MLCVKDLEVRYGGIVAASGVSFELKKGESLSLIGPNGAGKTSTLRAISGLVPPAHGEITFDGKELVNLPAYRIARCGVALVPEGRHLFGPLTVEENLLLGRQRLGSHGVSDGLAMVFDMLPKLKERRAQKAGSLSGGEQQMLVIGRALIGQPKIIMLDEPSMGLAPQMVDLIFEVLARLKSGGQTILLVEQNARLAMTFAERTIVLSVGRIVMQGLSADLLTQHEVIDAYLGSIATEGSMDGGREGHGTN
jgi:branched-chain amino acid transport system ATP-binding protein